MKLRHLPSEADATGNRTLILYCGLFYMLEDAKNISLY